MGFELEAKMKVADFAPVRQCLHAAGAEPKGEALERNVFFDTDSATLRAADKGLRLRTTRHLNSGRETHVFTYKGPRRQGLFKHREEVETTVGSFESGADLLQALGYRQTLSFEKRRESWQLKNCKVELDTLPYLGIFVEIEGPDETAVTSVRELLQLNDIESLQSGYVSMLMKYVEQHQIESRTLKLSS